MSYEERARRILAEQLGIPLEDLARDDDYFPEISMEELTSLMNFLEANFEVKIPPEDLEKIHSVADARAYLEERMSPLE